MAQKYLDIINLAVAGLLGLLWFDIRNIRKDKETDVRAIDQKITGLREGLFDVFMTKDKHELLCENSGLKIREHISDELKAMEGRILDAIKEG